MKENLRNGIDELSAKEIMEKLGLGENSVIAKFKVKCEKEIEALDQLERDLDIKENIRLSVYYDELEKELKEIQKL